MFNRNESGGARAATAVDFFQRFPSLFIFLLRELGSITGHTIGCKDAWPETVSTVSAEREIGKNASHDVVLKYRAR